MLGIESIGWACGTEIVDNLVQGAHWQRDAAFITEKIGFTSLRRLAPGQQPLDLCVEAVQHLQQKVDFSLHECDCLVVVTQNPASAGLPHMSAQLHGALKLPQHVAAFDLGLGCSGYVYALGLVTSFMKEQGLKCGLLFTADMYSPHLNPTDMHTQLLFGDAATCTLISEKPRYVVGRSVFSTDGARAQSLFIQPDGLLFMNGRGIFNFSMLSVPPQLAQCLEANSCSVDNIDYLLLHQASKFIVESLGERAGFSQTQIPFVLEDVGNCVSSTLPIALGRIWDKKPQKCLISGFGVGLSWASTVLFAQGV